MVNQNCKFNFEDVKTVKLGKYDPDELSDIKKRVLNLHSYLQSAAKRYDDFTKQMGAEQAKTQAIIDNVFQQEMSEIINLNEKKINAIEKFFANRLGLKQKALGLSPDFEFTTAGRLRENLTDMAQLGKGVIEDIVKMRGIRTIKQHSDKMKALLKQYGVTDDNVIARLRLDSIEVGQIPKLREVYKLGKKADAINMERYNRLIKEFQDIGMTDADIQNILSSSQKISAVMDEARLMGNALGLDIGQITDIGYMTRILTPDAKKLISGSREYSINTPSKANQSGLSAISQRGLSQPSDTLGTDVARSRQTFHYVPEDEKVVAYQLGIGQEELSDLIARGELHRYIHENASDELLDNMVEIGSLSKLPMTTTEVYDFIVKKYGDKLPFKGMKDIFVTDPKRIGEYYAHYLQEATYKSSLAKNIVREGLKNGWAVSPSVYKANPEQYKNFRFAKAEDIQRYFPQYKGKGLWIDKNVDDTWSSILGMASDPAVMNTWSNAVKSFGSFFNQSLLLSTGYPLRSLYSTFTASYSAGGNMLRFLEGYQDLMRITRGGLGYDALDSTQKVYKGLDGRLITEQELYRQWILKRGNDFAPETPGFQVEDDKFFSLDKANPFQLHKGINYLKHYFAAYGGVDGTREALNMFTSGQSEIFGKVALIASFMEAGGKWSTIKSLADTRTSQKVGQWVSGRPPQFNDLNQVFKHVDDYFTPWNDVGDFVRFMNNTIKPFSVFAMWNVPAQIRQAMRRPREFVNYYKIRSFMNQTTIGDDEDLNEGTVPSFSLWSSPQYLWKDEESNQWISILTSNFDARAEAINYLQKGEQQYERAMGRYVGTADEQRDQIRQSLQGNEPGMLSYFQDFLREGNPAILNALSVAFKYDIRKDRPIQTDPSQPRNTVFGVSPYVEYVLSSYPPLGKLINSNAFGWAGTPEFRDPKTGDVVIPAKPGVLGSRRVDFDITKYENDKQALVLRGLKVLGFNVNVVDVGRNLQWNFSESNSLYNQARSQLGTLQDNLTEAYLKGEHETSPQEFKRRLDLYNERVLQMTQLRADTIRLAAMMEKRGIKPTESFEQLEREVLDEFKVDFTNDQIKSILNDDLDMLITIDELEKLKENGN
jgi:hypothetical protein